jgi:transposase
VPRGQLGPRALALVGLLGTQYHLTQPKIRDLLAQTMGVNFSVGAISQAHALVSQALQYGFPEVELEAMSAGLIEVLEQAGMV